MIIIRAFTGFYLAEQIFQYALFVSRQKTLKRKMFKYLKDILNAAVGHAHSKIRLEAGKYLKLNYGMAKKTLNTGTDAMKNLNVRTSPNTELKTQASQKKSRIRK